MPAASVRIALALAATAFARAVSLDAATPIDREALVRRHQPVLRRFETGSPLSVGNGELAFTADATGLQTFVEAYEETVPLGRSRSGAGTPHRIPTAGTSTASCSRSSKPAAAGVSATRTSPATGGHPRSSGCAGTRTGSTSGASAFGSLSPTADRPASRISPTSVFDDTCRMVDDPEAESRKLLLG